MPANTQENSPRVAYFSMEIGIDPQLPTYSGGLGVLAGDTLKAAADLRLPVCAVTLLYRKGYFRQHIDAQGNQTESPVLWNPEDKLRPIDKKVSVQVGQDEVTLRAWRYDVIGATGHIVPIYFLDAGVESNSAEHQKLTDQLYGGDDAYRLSQEIVLGMGGVKLLNALGHKPADERTLPGLHTYHMNEGHSALLTLALLEYKNDGNKTLSRDSLDWVKERTVFTTHTPVPAGHDTFSVELTKELLGNDWTQHLQAWEVCPDGKLNMSHLAIKFSRYVNGVAKRHGEVSKEMFKGVDVRAVTNGVHSVSWTSNATQALFDKHLPGWREDNNYLRYACEIPTADIAAARIDSKKELFKVIEERQKVTLDPKVFTIGFARRAAEYKRGDLLLTNIETLKEIGKKHPVQIVFAGKAHPKDFGGKKIIKNVVEKSLGLVGSNVSVVYLENYDMELGRLICAGVDLWLNNPVKPLEASGTSGMKAAINGSPNFSTLDGWWVEGCVEGITGWEIKDDAYAFGGERDDGKDREKTSNYMYQMLNDEILRLYYKEPELWNQICRHSIALNGPFFNTHRMVWEYNQQVYRN